MLKQPLALFSDNYYDSFDPYWASRRVYDFASFDKPGETSDVVIIYDQSVQWFAEIWHIKRQYFYNRYTIMSTRN